MSNNRGLQHTRVFRALSPLALVLTSFLQAAVPVWVSGSAPVAVADWNERRSKLRALMLKMIGKLSLMVPLVLASLIFMGSPAVVQAEWLTQQQISENTSVNNTDIDVAIDSGDVSHAVYVRGGNIYYVKGVGDEEFVAAGSKPAIAVGPNGVPQVVYASASGQFYITKAGGVWLIPIKISNYNREIDIDIDAGNYAHIVYVAQIDTSYPSDYSTAVDIGYINNINGTELAPFSIPLVLWRGIYENLGGSSYQGFYYDKPRIKVDSDGAYHVIAAHEYYYRDPSNYKYYYYYVLYKTNSGDGFGSNTVSRDAAASLTLNALTLAPSGRPMVVYTQSGATCYASPTSTWSEIALTDVTSPALASNDVSIGLAYVNSGTVYLMTDDGVGFGTPVAIDTGSAPALGLGSNFVYYLKSDGANNEVFLMADVSFESAPEVTQHPASAAVEYGDDAVFTAAAEGLPAPTVQWQVNPGTGFINIDGATTTTLTIPDAAMAFNGAQFRAVFTNTTSTGPNTATTNAAILTVNPRTVTPVITVENRAYDGTVSATILSLDIENRISGDEVSLTGGTATFDNKDVGDNKAVTITGLSLSGDDEGNYRLPTGDITTTANITKATPVITWADPVDIVYGTELSGTQLNATADVLGTFVYDPIAGTILDAGDDQTLGVTFTPEDTGNYNNASGTATLNVAKAAAYISFGPVIFTYDGTPKIPGYATTPPDLTVILTYNGSPTPPTSTGQYSIYAEVDDLNYEYSTGIHSMWIVFLCSAFQYFYGDKLCRVFKDSFTDERFLKPFG